MTEITFLALKPRSVERNFNAICRDFSERMKENGAFPSNFYEQHACHEGDCNLSLAILIKETCIKKEDKCSEMRNRVRTLKLFFVSKFKKLAF